MYTVFTTLSLLVWVNIPLTVFGYKSLRVFMYKTMSDRLLFFSKKFVNKKSNVNLLFVFPFVVIGTEWPFGHSD